MPDGTRLPSPQIEAPAAVDSSAVASAAAGPARRFGLRAAAVAGLMAALGWAGLTGGAPSTWLFGLPTVAAVALLARAMAPGRAAPRLSLRGAAGFAVWFAWQALRGATDVALRAFHPRLPVAPGWVHYPLALPPGAPRLVMANAITLLPGTLTAELHEDHLIVHVLDSRADAAAELAALEGRVRALFALPPLHRTPERRP